MSAVTSMSTVHEVGRGIHAIPADFDGVPLTVYLVEGGGALALVDCGVASTPERDVRPALAGLGAAPRDVELLVLTHAHHDHVGGSGAMRAANPDLSIAIHHIDAPWVESAERYFTQLYEELFPGAPLPGPGFRDRILGLMGDPAPVDRPLEDGDTLRAAGRELEVVAAPAHSPGHILLHDADAGALFVGDALQGWGFEIGGRPRLFPFYLSVPAYRRALDAIGATRAGLVCTAHFGALDREGCRDLIAASLAFVDALEALLVAELERRGRITLAEGAAAALAAWPQFAPGVQAHATVNAHLNELARQRRAAPALGPGGEKSWVLI